MPYKPRPHSAKPEPTRKERAAQQATRNFDIGLPVVAGRGDGRKGRDHGGVELLKNVSGETALETLANSIDSALDPSKASSKPVVTQHSVPKKAVHHEDYVDYHYRAVVHRTEKAVKVAIAGRHWWFPKSAIEFLPGNILRAYRRKDPKNETSD